MPNPEHFLDPREPGPSTTAATGGAVGRTLTPDEVLREAQAFLAPSQAPDEMGRLGRYRVMRILGAGGMGIVLEAEDTALQRPVALKVMKRTLTGGTAPQRFLQEARATAALVHDHIVTIHDVDEAPLAGAGGSVPFLAMQLLQGETLEARLRREPVLPVAEAVRIGRQIAVALAAAHQRGLIHRDIKPANVWLEAPTGRVKVLDFGLVLAMGVTEAAPPAAAVDADARLTQEGAIVGTPAYMAPEQAQGGGPIDARCDLFSLGCVLYQLCTGLAPFRGATTLQTLEAVLCHHPPPPTQHRSKLPRGLSALVMHLLAKRADDRPASAAQVAESLAAIERIQAAPRRWGVGLAVTAAGILIAVGLAAYWNWPADRSGVVEQRLTPAGKPSAVDKGEPPIVGELAAVARYPRPPTEVAAAVNALNGKLRAGWQANRLTPSPPIDDYGFIRRVSLDLVGRIARTDELRTFLADPPQSRRALLVDRLLASEEYAATWADTWTTWLVGRSGPFGRGPYRDQLAGWLQREFAQNRPFHELARSLLTAEGDSSDNGAVHFILAHVGQPIRPADRVEDGQFDMVPLTTQIKRVFLGIRGDCYQCHDHPFNSGVRQEHFWVVNSLLRQVEVTGRLPGDGKAGSATLTVKDNPNAARRGMVLYEKRQGLIAQAVKPDAARSSYLPRTLKLRRTSDSRREQLARAVIDNEQFSAAIVNRTWARFFGHGFAHPLDDFNDVNTPAHPEVLDELASRFRREGHDLRKLIRWICLSQAYQLSHIANPSNGRSDHERLFSRMSLKPLSPEQLFASVAVATRTQASESKAARDAWIDELIYRHWDGSGADPQPATWRPHLLAGPGGCRAAGAEEPIEMSGSLTQALLLMNGQRVNGAIAGQGPAALARATAQGEKPEAVITQLYLAALNRPPRPEELRLLREDLVHSPDFYEDLLWALLNSNAFAFNH